MAVARVKRQGSNDDCYTVDPATGLFTRNYAIVEAGILTPLSFSAGLDNYNPPGLSEAHTLRMNPTGPNGWLSGIAGGTAGRQLRLQNINSGFSFPLFNQAISSAVNQFILPRALPLYLEPNDGIDIWYDGLSNLWRPTARRTVSTVISVAVPTLAATVLSYLDVSLAGGALAGLTSGDPIIVCPQADLAAAGAGNGYFIGARMASLNSCRLWFVGTLVGANVNFLFSTPG